MPESIQLKGIPVSPGIAIGPVFLYRSELDQVSAKSLAYVDIEREIALFKSAVEKAKQQLREIKKMISEERMKDEHVAIFDTHILLLEDPLVIEETIRLIRQERKSADYIFYKVIDNLARRLEESGDEYFKSRGTDLYDIANRVIRNLRQSYSHILDELK
ncbi:MAG: phosphoenolpyruvate--protein phosphotransferase, partial [Candidatus Sumerlaeia bacterium]|nr:phosphoenolpyruvate--protein phosphotransferase [Candidatus Sumerlaeia bacterium]